MTDVVGNSARVNWGTDQSQTTGSVTWGAVSGGSCTPANQVAATKSTATVGTKSEYQWTAVLNFPSAGTYCYRVQLGTTDLLGTNASPQVTTAAAPGSSYSFAVIGDWGAGGTGEANVMSQIGASPANFVMTVGDNVYNSGTDTEYGDLSSGNVFPTQYLPALGNRPVFAATGNHGFTDNLPYIHNFPGMTAALTSGGRFAQESYCCISTLSGPSTYASAWYAFNWGSARFYVLDAAWADSQGAYQGDFLAHWNGSVSGCAPCGAEMQWLKADLAAHASTPLKFAFFHYPLHADNGGEPSDTYLDGPSGLEGVLASNNVDVVFNGHAHQYERNKPQIAGSPMVSYVTGTGGAPLGSVSGCSAFDAYAIGSGSSCNAPTPASDANVYGFLLVTVKGNQVTVTPTDSTGRTFDVQTYTFATTPTTVIDTQPAALTNSTSATFTFHSTGGSPGFTCSLDGAAATACTSPTTYTALSQGAHTFTVTGNGADPATANWTVDTSPPSIPTLSGKAVSSHEVDLSWTPSSDNTGVTGYDVIRNGSTVATVSGSTLSYADTTVAPSTPYTYEVDARDGAGNVSNPSTPLPVTTPAAPPGPVLVQEAGSSTTTVTLPIPSTAGDLLVLTASVYTGKSKPITAVSDGKNTWTKVGAYAVSGNISDGEMWYAPNAASVSSVTVTTSATAVALQLQEFSGVATSAPLDGLNGSAATSTTASSGTATPTASNDLAVGFVAGHGNAEAVTINSPGYTDQPEQITSSPSVVTVDSGSQTLGSMGAQSFGATFGTAMYWAAGVALFKAGSPPPPQNDFSIGASPASGTVTAGSSATTTISTAVTSGSAQSVALSATGAPSGALVSFSPQTVTAGQTSTMTVTTSSTTPTGTYPITVTGTGTSVTHNATYSVTVNPAPVAPTITSANKTTFTEGTAGSFTVTSSGVPTPAITESGSLPSGVGLTDNGDGTATLSGTPASGSAGSYPVTITASNGVGSPVSQSFTLTVAPAPSNDFSIGSNPTSATVTAGSPGTTTISTAVTSGSAQSVALSATGAPSGALVSFSPQTITAGQTSTMTVTTSSTTPIGTYPITVTGTGTSVTHTTSFSITVNPLPPNDFSIDSNPTSATVTAGSPGTTTISTAVTSGSAQSVALSATGAPSGALVSFSPQTITAGQTSTMTVTTSSTTPTGTYPITVTGTGTSVTHTTSFSLTVNPVPAGPVFVQAASATETTTSTSLSGSFPSATKSSDLLVLTASVYAGATNHITSVTDSAGNTWTRVGAYDVSGHYSDGELWYAANAAPVTTVTVHVSAAASIAFEAQDFSGAATASPLDTSAGTSNTSTSPSSGNASASAANELAVGFVSGHTVSQPITVTASGFTNQAEQTSTSPVASVVAGYAILSTAGSQSYGATLSSAAYWAAGIAIFKP